MDASDQVLAFEKFIRQEHYVELVEKARIGERHLIFDFKELSIFNLDIVEDLLKDPEETLKAAEIAAEQFDLPNHAKDFKVRIKNLPDSQNILIRNIRSKDIGRFITVEGVVRQKSDVRPQVMSSKYECPSCGNIIPILQFDTKLNEPTRCNCGRKGKFRLLSKELVDAQSMTLEECTDDLEGGEQAKRMKVFVKQDLVSPLSEKKTNPGTKIILNGYVKDIPIILRTGGQSTKLDLMIEANYIEPVMEEFGEINISEEDEKQIKAIAKDPKVIEKVVNSIAPLIYGHDKLKEALMLQLVGGVKKVFADGSKTRGDSHILLVGDPGAGKSVLLKRINVIAPKSRFVSGKGASGVGLTASVVKDDFIGGWALEAGALVLANKGIICLDELDKMSKDDTSAMHEAMEGQTVTISKANIQATLRCETTILAAANPKMGRFDPYSKTIAEQIELPSTLINRFDLIFAIKDIPHKEKDEKLARFMNKKNKSAYTETKDEDKIKPDIETDLLRKFIAYVKRKRPQLTKESEDELVSYYLKMRSSGKGEEGLKSIPISPRQYEALIRISEGYAKIRLSEQITKKDAKKAIGLMDYCLKEIAYDQETQSVDIDRIATGMPTSKRSKIVIVKNIISELEEQIGKTIPIEDIIVQAEKKGIDEDDVESALEKLKKSGDIFEPKRGFVAKT